VLQLVAIKQLQSEGKSLVEIQDELTGATNRKLSGLVKLPSHFWDSFDDRLRKAKPHKSKKQKPPIKEPEALPAATTETQSDGDAFWKKSPSVNTVSETASQPTFKIRETTQLEFPNGVTISIPVASDQITPELIEQITPTISKLLSQISQGTPTENHNQPSSSQDNT